MTNDEKKEEQPEYTKTPKNADKDCVFHPYISISGFFLIRCQTHGDDKVILYQQCMWKLNPRLENFFRYINTEYPAKMRIEKELEVEPPVRDDSLAYK